MAIYGFLYLPVLLLVIYSVNSSRFSLQWQGFSTRWYWELIEDRALWEALIHSIVLGVLAALIATGLSVLASVRIFLFKRKQWQCLHTGSLLLIIIPDLVMGVALLLFFHLGQLPLGFCSLLIAHITFCIPFVVITLNARLEMLDANIYYSALDLGATHLQALRKVFLPLLWPAILSAGLLAFTLSFDDVIVSYFVAGPDFSVLPLVIYSLVRVGVTPELNALCTLTLAFSMCLVLLAQGFARKSA
ncbi:MAG: ABC transporter permease subunit [Legionella sp.]|nr:ABC transporter permease subunit [Legionella sp.]